MCNIPIYSTMAHECDSCNKKFTRKDSLTQHKKRKACKNNEYYCKFCNKGFTTDTSMYRHIRDFCKVKKEKDGEKDAIYEKLIQIEKENKQIKEQYEKIIQDNKQLTKTIHNIHKTNNIIKNNNINTGTVNNTNNIIIVGYGKEDLSRLDKTELLKILQTGYNSTVKLTEAVHFNPKHPEYHNVYISNMKDKYAMMYDGKQWTLTTKEDLITKIYEDKKSFIEENLEEFIESLTLSRKRALERWLDTDDEDKKIKDIKDNIKLLLYNSRQLPLKCIEMNDSNKKKRVKKEIKDSISDNDDSEPKPEQSEEIEKIVEIATKKPPVVKDSIKVHRKKVSKTISNK
jgi:hypothetical protein